MLLYFTDPEARTFLLNVSQVNYFRLRDHSGGAPGRSTVWAHFVSGEQLSVYEGTTEECHLWMQTAANTERQ